MKTDQIPRTGDVPLEIRGHVLAHITTKEPAGEGRFRWHELTLYDLGGERYAVHVTYRSEFLRRGSTVEPSYDWGQVLDGPEALIDWLQKLRESRPVLGWPTGEHYAERQKRLLKDLRLRYERAVTLLLKPLGTEVVA